MRWFFTQIGVNAGAASVAAGDGAAWAALEAAGGVGGAGVGVGSLANGFEMSEPAPQPLVKSSIKPTVRAASARCNRGCRTLGVVSGGWSVSLAHDRARLM
jgi:hypothetical protein